MLERLVGSNQTCTSHEECNYFDCRGRCDLIEERCAAEVVNNNLQAVCENVLSARHENVFFEIPGLLSSNHINKKLKNALDKCSNPTNSKENIRLGSFCVHPT